jgi:ketosteroid isomerase-like protein
MDDTENVVRNLYAALARGDVPAAVALMSPRVEWLEAEHTPYYAGLVIGPDKVVETVFEPVNKDFENFALTEQNYITQGTRTAAIGVYRGRQRQTGRELRAPFVHIWEVSEGKIKRFTQYTDSGARAEANLPT